MKNFELKAAARANLGLVTSFAVVALTIGVMACGSDKKAANPGATDSNGTTVVNPCTVVGNPTSPKDCNSTHGRTFNGTASTISYNTSAGNISLPNAFYISTAAAQVNGDNNKIHKIAAFDYDYCDFTYDFGYGSGPLKGFHNAIFYLVNGTPGAALATGTYTVGAGSSSQYIFTNSASGATTSVVQASTGGTAGQKCASTYSVPTGGSLTITQLPAGAGDPNQTRFNSGLQGSFNLTFANGQSVSGDFTSGGCTGGDGTTDATRIQSCTCSL